MSEEDNSQARSPSGAPSGGVAVEDILSADDIFQRVAATADDEFRRSPRTLFFSGIAAGLSIGLTFLTRAALGAKTESIGELPGDLLYPLGFVLVALGRYQLFTENTLTPVTLVLTRLASVPALLRLWGVVVVANLIGAAAASWLMSMPQALDPLIDFAATEIAKEALEEPVDTLFIRGVIAGAIVASMVWLTHAVREGAGRVLVVYGTMILIPIASLYHCITGFSEVMYGVIEGEGTVGQACGFFGAVALGNLVGGVLLVAFINFGQADANRFPERRTPEHRLGWRELLFGHRTGRPSRGRVAPERDEDPQHAGGSA